MQRAGRYARERLDECLTPPRTRVLFHVMVEFVVVDGALLLAHGDGGVDGVDELVRIPRIDDETAGKRFGDASEFGQDEAAVTLVLAGNVLFGDEVHAIAGGGDKAHVGDGVECNELIEGDGIMDEVDWGEFNRAKLAVDATDELIDDSPQVLVFFDILATGYGDLDEDYFADPFRMFRQEDFDSMQFLRYTLDIVKAVDTDHELDALELS